MNKSDQEDKIIEKIKTFIDEQLIDVRPYPNTEAEFNAVTTKSRIYVGFEAADFTKPKSTAETAQEVTDHFDIWLISKLRRGTSSINEMYGTLCDNLIGFKPPDSGRLFGLKYRFGVRESGVFKYCFTLGTLTNVVQNFTGDNGPGLNEVGFEFSPPPPPGPGDVITEPLPPPPPPPEEEIP